MPIYEYRCPACDTAFEELVRSEAAARDVGCPKCGHHKVIRQPSVFAAHAAPTKRSSPPPACGGCNAGASCPLAGG